MKENWNRRAGEQSSALSTLLGNNYTLKNSRHRRNLIEVKKYLDISNNEKHFLLEDVDADSKNSYRRVQGQVQ